MVSKENGRDLVTARSSGALAGRRISRGGFLRLAGAGVLAGAGLPILGCTANTTPRQASNNGGSGKSREKKLNLFTWSDYMPPSMVPDFEKDSGVKVAEDYYASNDELVAKLQAGGTGYDWIVPTDSYVQIMTKSGLLEPLDRAEIPNVENIGEDFRNLPYDPDNRYSVPYQWGTTGILYDKKKVGEITSWDALWDRKYKGKVAMLDDVREVIGAALKRLGYSLNSTDAAQLDEAKRSLVEQKPLLQGYFDVIRMRDLIKSGELLLGQVYSGAAFTAVFDSKNLDYVIPEEGATRWTDNMCVPRGAPHPEVAHEFINYILKPKIGAALSNYTYYATPNKAAMPFIAKEARNDPRIYPPPEVFDKLEVARDLGKKTRDYQRIFTEVKSS